MEKVKKKMVSFRLSPEQIALVEELALAKQLSKTQVLELAVQKLAEGVTNE